MNNTSLSVNGSLPYTDIAMMSRTKITMYSVVLVWALISNILVIAVIVKNKQMHNNFNYLIINMAISDLIIPCVGLPMQIVAVPLRPREWLVDGLFGALLCKLGHFVADISPAVSAFSLVIIAANRCIAIAYPMKRKLTHGRTIKLIAATWIMAFLLLCPYFYTFRLETSQGWLMCTSRWSPAFDDLTAEMTFIVVILVVVFFIPGVTNTILYSIMLYKLRQNSRNVALMLNSQQSRRRQHKDKNIFIMTVVIMIVYLALWGPFFCALFVLTLTVQDNSINTEAVAIAITVVQFLGYLHSAVNPCIYFLFLRNLRQGLVKLFCDNALVHNMEFTGITSQRFRASTMSSAVSVKRKRSFKASSV